MRDTHDDFLNAIQARLNGRTLCLVLVAGLDEFAEGARALTGPFRGTGALLSFPNRGAVMRTFFEEFKKFILRGNVVDLAVGVVIGTAFGKIVDSLVKDIFLPIVGVLTGGFDVSGQSVTLYKDAKLNWGGFVQSLITFIVVGFCMFLVVKGANALHKYVLKDAGTPVAEPTPTEKLLTEIRDLLKRNSGATAPTATPGTPEPA